LGLDEHLGVVGRLGQVAQRVEVAGRVGLVHGVV
jgi:hypothetical protein